MSVIAGRVMPLPRGVYSASTEYHILDIVSYNNAAYIALQTTQGNVPTNTAYWQKIADSATMLAQMSDVNITTPTDGEVLTYDATNQEWVNGEATTDLASLDDTTITNPSNGQVLTYNSTGHVWVNGNASAGLLPHFIIISDAGSTVSVITPGGATITPTQASSDHWECDVPEFGTYTIHAVLSGDDAVMTVAVDAVKIYTIDDEHFHASIRATYPGGATCRCQGGGENYYATGSPYTFSVHHAATYAITVTLDGISKTENVVITTEGQSENVTIEFGTIELTYDDDFRGTSITCTNGTTTITKTAPASGNTMYFYPPSTGSWTISGIVSGETYSTRADVASLSIPVAARLMTIVKFAFHYSENDNSPDSVTYPAGYDNSDYTDTFYVDLTTGVPHYGDWDKTDDKNRWLFPKMCMLKYDGTRDYYLYEDDVTKKEDGVTASDVANFSYGGNAMVEWGQDGRKIYWKIVPDGDNKGFTFVVANGQADSDMHAWNHYNCRGELAEHFYTPMYYGSSNGGKLRSISGGTNYVNNPATTELSLAKANNQTSDELWNTEVYADWLLTAMLCILLSKSTNSQAKFGYGRCSSSNTSAIGQGTMNTRGLFYGRSDQTSGVKVFGMENPWGNLWRRIAGLINVNGTVKLKLTYGQEDGSTVDGYNTTGSGYITSGSIGGTNGGYTSAMNISDRGLIPKTISGSDSTYYCDGGWFNNSQVDYAFVGGAWHSGLRVGCLCVDLGSTVSSAYAGDGAALSCKPLA